MSVHFIRSDLHLAVNFIKKPYGKFIQRQNLVFKAVLLAEPAGKGTNFSLLLCSNLHASVAYCALAGELTGSPEPIQITEIRKSAQEKKNNRPNVLKKALNQCQKSKAKEKRQQR